ncbi:PIG-L family deacetylase [Streptosporangium sp. NBC_01639]|uniref:PIG-L deacetylase family protein n=1 Tax=unclassified Streptosporangium TaxID=2632669 RepID=UPI002DDC6843|nr:PIG-L family deacetylase [Streptosporangium sp. NBC_01756]WSC84715.1 PIG-L family deacetylase [Streptosporangium sp. NBC_01756]WTD56652.1 PIG-L family deacetylase [Streptosporangium sp. NBC_01639]
MTHVLAIGAHAGDMDLTAGAVLAQHVQAGDQATLLHLTLGERGHPRVPVAEYAEQKREEAERFAAAIGAGVRFLDYEDGLLPEDEDVKMRVGDLIRELRPDVVLTHWSESIHKDHARTHRIVLDARFYGGLRTLARELPAYWAGELYYADNWEDAEGYRPDVSVELTEEAYETWSQAITGYAFARGETYGFPYVDYYRALTIVRGAPAGFRRAQAFMAPKGSRDVRTRYFGKRDAA